MEGKPYKDTDGKWKNPDGTPYVVVKGEQPPWLLGKDFSARKGDIKPGRGKTSLVSLAKKWREEGNDAELTKKQLQDLYKQMLKASRKEIKVIAKDDNMPLTVTVMAESLLDPKTRAKTLQDIQTWIWGKATQEIEVTKKTVVTTPEKEAIEQFLKDKY